MCHEPIEYNKIAGASYLAVFKEINANNVDANLSTTTKVSG